MATQQPPVRLTTHKNFAYRLVLATLTGRPVHISQIRPDSVTATGLSAYEISFLRLLEAVTNGSHIEISYTGSIILYKPGLITGSAPGSGASGGVITHEIQATNTRGLSYFLIPLCLLAPFSKAPINVMFQGPGVITSAVHQHGDISVDSVRTAILPLFQQFGVWNNIELKILQRSCVARNGVSGGQVQLLFAHQLRLPKTLHLLNPGKIKRIRGVAYSVGVSGSNNARMIDVARGILNPLVPDTYVFSDVSSAPLVPDYRNPGSKRKSGIGFGISLVAESSTGCLYSADAVCPPTGGEPPEDIGRKCAYQLLHTVSLGGCVSPVAFPTFAALMSMGSEDVGRLRIGRDLMADEKVITLARDLAKFGMAGWGMRDDPAEDSDDLILSIVGRGIGNVGRKIA
ncbi:hypothetical protein KEM55_002476 [Ascosphaera atra]|nr:hypothetical protein KEM55_002476 [Ascosphaera atra]